VAGQIGLAAVVDLNRRFTYVRRRHAEQPNAGYHIIGYRDAGFTGHYWQLAGGWNGFAQHVFDGDVEVHIWSDGTSFFCDIFDMDSVSILPTPPASIAIASVKDFTSGTTFYWGEWYTDFAIVSQGIRTFFIRKYVSPEPTHGAWGAEESR
jgi:hypothetical protein